MSKTVVMHKGAEFIIAKDGAEAVKITADAVMATDAVCRLLDKTVKASGTLRAAMTSWLSLVYASPRMDSFRAGESNACSLAEGKPTKEFKAAVRSAEDDVVLSLVKDGSLKLKDEKAIQAFISGLREDKNYSNAKVTCNRYVAFAQKNVVTDDGFLIPIEAMKAELAELLPKTEQDNSFAAQLRAVEEGMAKGTIPSDDAIESLVIVRSLLSTLEGIVSGNALHKTENVEARAPLAPVADIPAQSASVLDNAMASAKATLASVINSKAPAAGRQVAKGFGAKMDERRSVSDKRTEKV